MKKFALLFFALLLILPGVALGAGKLEAVSKNLIIFDGEDTGYFFAKIQNTGDEPIGVDTGSLVAFGEDDEILLASDYVTSSPYGIMLSPGDYVYVRESLWSTELETNPVADYKFSVKSRDNVSMIEKIPCEVTYELNGEDIFGNYIYVTYTNTTDQLHYDFVLTVALFDADGNILFVRGESISTTALHPGSSMTLKVSVDYDLVEYYVANGLEPVTADAMICYPVE